MLYEWCNVYLCANRTSQTWHKVDHGQTKCSLLRSWYLSDEGGNAHTEVGIYEGNFKQMWANSWLRGNFKEKMYAFMVDIRPVGDVASRECDRQIDGEEEELLGPGHEVGVEEHGWALHKPVMIHTYNSIFKIKLFTWWGSRDKGATCVRMCRSMTRRRKRRWWGKDGRLCSRKRQIGPLHSEIDRWNGRHLPISEYLHNSVVCVVMLKVVADIRGKAVVVEASFVKD